MAQPLNVTRATAVRLIARIEELYAAAVKAGHPAGPALTYGDGMTRAEARAFRQWASGIPQISRTLHDRGGFQDEAQAILRLATYFEADHPQLADGAPAPWPASETLSPAMEAFARRDSHSLDPAALLPREVEALVHYARVRHQPSDFEGEAAGRVRDEIEQLTAAAEKAAETTSMFDDNAAAAPGTGQEKAVSNSPERAAAIEQRDALWRDPEFQAAYHSPHINIRRQAIDELLGLNRIIAGETGPAAGIGTAAPRQSVIAPPATTQSFTPPAAPARKAPPYDPAALRQQLAGLSGAARQARLAELFPETAAPSTTAPIGVVTSGSIASADAT